MVSNPLGTKARLESLAQMTWAHHIFHQWNPQWSSMERKPLLILVRGCIKIDLQKFKSLLTTYQGDGLDHEEVNIRKPVEVYKEEKKKGLSYGLHVTGDATKDGHAFLNI